MKRLLQVNRAKAPAGGTAQGFPIITP